MNRHDGRKYNDMRPVEIRTGYLSQPHGSVLITVGDTRVLCNAMVEESVPPFLRDLNEGWVTGEYAMLPAATNTRTQRTGHRRRRNATGLDIATETNAPQFAFSFGSLTACFEASIVTEFKCLVQAGLVVSLLFQQSIFLLGHVHEPTSRISFCL